MSTDWDRPSIGIPNGQVRDANGIREGNTLTF